MKTHSHVRRSLPAILVLALLSLTLTANVNFAEESCPAGTNEVFKGPVGLALYSLRATISEDFDEALALAQSYGVRYVELYDLAPANLSSAELLAKLQEYGLTAVAAYFDYGEIRDNPESVAVRAKELGVLYAGISWLPHDGALTEEAVREAAEVFNHAGEVLANEGITFYFHNHGYEFQPYEDRTLFHLMVELSDPRYVAFEMDVLWVVFPGQDPAALLRKYPGRFPILHLKDLRKGVEGNLSGGTASENRVVLGQGQIDYPELLRAAQETGVQYYLIEDETTDPLKSIPESLEYLESVRW
ncbi:MAG: sugar phosphate isomerase/epimerase [Planctomycetia bacterium]|nr:sugar phosphate isomerase/epimerase [Planctomycetia bacterium]